jgi:hypothetical protein
MPQTRPDTPPAFSPSSPQFGTNITTPTARLPFDLRARTLYLDGSPIPREPNETAYAIELHGVGHHIIARAEIR